MKRKQTGRGGAILNGGQESLQPFLMLGATVGFKVPTKLRIIMRVSPLLAQKDRFGAGMERKTDAKSRIVAGLLQKGQHLVGTARCTVPGGKAAGRVGAVAGKLRPLYGRGRRSAANFLFFNRSAG